MDDSDSWAKTFGFPVEEEDSEKMDEDNSWTKLFGLPR